MIVAPALPTGVERVTETADGRGVHTHPGWSAALPWVIQGITSTDADMSLFGSSAVGEVVPRWQQLRDSRNCRTIVHARQVHRGDVLVHADVPPGLLIAPDADGHVTHRAGVLLAVSVADCVPVSIIAADVRAIALLHAGWRGVAAGILENGMRALRESFGADPASLHVHFGPSICGECFEVGDEVPRGVGVDAAGVTHVDLRARLAERAIAAGALPAHISVSAHCTRHGDSPFFSHRGGCRERQIAVLGIRGT